MALKLLDFETGPEGTALTAGNSGASQITTNAGTAVFSKTVVRSGSLGARFNSVNNALCIGRFTTNASNVVLSANATFTVVGTPNIILGIWSLRGSGVAGRVNWNPDNSLTFVDAGLGNTLTIATGLTPGVVYELSLRARAATSTTGTITAVLYNVAGVELGRATSSSYNLGTVALSAVDVGILNTNAAANSFAIDYLQLDDGNTAELRAPQGAPAYSGTASTSSGTSASGSGAAASSGMAATSAITSASGAGAPRPGGTSATSSGTSASGVGSSSGAGSGEARNEVGNAAAGVATVAAATTTASSTVSTGLGQVAAWGAASTLAGVTASGAGSSSEDAGGTAGTSSGTSASGTGRVTARGAGSTTVATTGTGAGRIAVARGVTTLVTVVGSGVGSASLSGDGVTLVEVATAGAGFVPAEAHDVDVAAWLSRPRYAAALGGTRYDGAIKANRWRARL